MLQASATHCVSGRLGVVKFALPNAERGSKGHSMIGGRIRSLILNQLRIIRSIFGFIAAIQSSDWRMWSNAMGDRTSTTGGREGGSTSSVSGGWLDAAMRRGGDDISIGVGMTICCLMFLFYIIFDARSRPESKRSHLRVNCALENLEGKPTPVLCLCPCVWCLCVRGWLLPSICSVRRWALLRELPHFAQILQLEASRFVGLPHPQNKPWPENCPPGVGQVVVVHCTIPWLQGRASLIWENFGSFRWVVGSITGWSQITCNNSSKTWYFLMFEYSFHIRLRRSIQKCSKKLFHTIQCWFSDGILT